MKVHKLKKSLEDIFSSNTACFSLLLIFASLLVLQPHYTYLLYNNIDPSFNFGVQKAALEHLTFGTQFISTYGPLSFMDVSYLPQFFVLSSLWLIIYVILLCTGVFLFMKAYQIFGGKKMLFILTSFGLIYAFAIPQLEWRYLSLFLLYEFIYVRLRKNKTQLLVGLCFFASLFIFIKFSLGLAALGSLALLNLQVLTRKKESIKKLALKTAETGALVALFMIAMSLVLNVALPQYLKAGLLLSGDYSDVMSWTYPGYRAGLAAIAVLTFVLLVWIFVDKKKFTDSIKSYSFLLFPLYTGWKNAIVRQDGFHFTLTLLFLLPIILVVYLVKTKEQKNQALKLKDIGAVVIILALVLVSHRANDKSSPQAINNPVRAPAVNAATREFVNFFKLKNQKNDWTQETNSYLQLAKLPENMRQTIGNNKVDVFPWETSIIYANNLKWANRPSPFSFETYDPYLDSLNAQYMQSKSSPEFIIWQNFDEVEGIDNRYILWDEPATFRSILANYKTVDHNNKFILLKKDKQSITTRYSGGPKAIPWDTWTRVPETNNQAMVFVSGQYKEDISLKVRSLLLRVGIVSIALKYTNGDIKTYRFGPPNLSQGLIISPDPITWEDLASMLGGQTSPNDKVQEFKFTANQQYINHSTNIQGQFFKSTAN